MADNAFDQFDAPAAAPASNAFDQFDAPKPALTRSGVGDFVDKQLPTDANAPSYASGAGYLIDNPLTRSFGGVANRVAQGAAHIVGATDAEQALQERASAFNSPSDANTLEKVVHTVGGVAGAAPAFVLGGVPGAAALAATNTGADLSDRDAAGQDTSLGQKVGIGAANLITNFLPVHLGGGLTRRIVAGATIGAGGAALNNAAQGNDLTSGLATGALIGGAFGGLHRSNLPAEVPPPPAVPPTLALTHQPDVTVDAQGRAVMNKGDRTLGQPVGGAFEDQAPRFPGAQPGSLADVANTVDANSHLAPIAQPTHTLDAQGNFVENKPEEPDQSGVPDSVYKYVHDMQDASSGLIDVGNYLPEEQAALRNAGLVQKGELPAYTDEDGETTPARQHEGVDRQDLLPERERRYQAEIAGIRAMLKGATDNGRGNTPDNGSEPPAESNAAGATGPTGQDSGSGAAASVDPDAAHKAAFETRLDAIAQAHGFTPEQTQDVKDKLFQPLPRDRVTGFYEANQLDPAIQRAQDFVRTSGKPAVLVNADFQGLGALNAHAGGNAAADPHFAEIMNGLNEHLKESGDDVQVAPVRRGTGSDEFSFIVTGADPQAALAAGNRARAEIADYSRQHGLDNMAQVKKGEGYGDTVGAGVHLGVTPIDPNASIGDIVQHADRQIEARKHGALDYEFRGETGEAGAEPPSERPESAGSGTDASTGVGSTERPVGDQSAVAKSADQQPAGSDNASRPDVAGANRASDAITEQSPAAKSGGGADRDSLPTVKTSVGDVAVDRSHDIPLLGSSSKDGTVHIDKDWDPVIKDGPLKGLDRTPFLVEHEAVEAHAEKNGQNYSQSHYGHAEPAEHKMLLDHLGLKEGTPEADKAIEAYEQSYKQDLKDAAAKKNPQVPPDLIVKPYEHPHSEKARIMAADVESQQTSEPGTKADHAERGAGTNGAHDRFNELDAHGVPAWARTDPRKNPEFFGIPKSSRGNILDSVAKAGGLNREAFRKEFGSDPAQWRTREAQRSNMRGFGKPLFRKEGGMSPDQLREHLQQHGWLNEDDPNAPPKYTVSDAHDLIDRAIRGDTITHPADSDHEALASHIEQQQTDFARDHDQAKERGFDTVDAMREHDANNLYKGEPRSDIPFARGESRRGMPKASVADALKEPLSELGGDAPKIFIHQSHDEAPPNLRRSKGFDRSVKGAYDPNTNSVHLFADSIHTPREAKEVLTHEVIGHYGVERVVGKDWGKLVADINAMRERSPAAMKDIFKEVDSRYPSADKDTFAGEAMAIMAERGIKNSIMDRVLSAVRRFIRSMGLDVKYSDAELRQILVAAKNHVEGIKWLKPSDRNGPLSFHKAFHGSPHDFDQFDSSKIGTGEGAQAYGHGLYFAGKKEVADHYRRALSERQAKLNPGDVRDNLAESFPNEIVTKGDAGSVMHAAIYGLIRR